MKSVEVQLNTLQENFVLPSTQKRNGKTGSQFSSYKYEMDDKR